MAASNNNGPEKGVGRRESIWRRMLMNGLNGRRRSESRRGVVGVGPVTPTAPPWGALPTDHTVELLVLGFGDVARRDEGVGVSVVRHLKRRGVPKGVNVVDAGTGDLQLVDCMHAAKRIVVIDGAYDGRPAGTVDVIKPHCPADYPCTLSSHDRGLGRLLERFYAPGEYVEVTLFAIAIEGGQRRGMGLTGPVWDCVPRVADLVLEEATRDAVTDEDNGDSEPSAA